MLSYLLRSPGIFVVALLGIFAFGCSDPPEQNNASDTSDMEGDFAASPAECGNNVVEDGEVCDDGNRHSTDYCSWNCKEIIGYCGDEITQSNEDCEVDYELEPCSKSARTCRKCIDCQLVDVEQPPRCGDHIVQPELGEECENPRSPDNVFPGPGSGSLLSDCIDCRLVVYDCGNGEVQPDKGEVCDNGWRAANRRGPPGVGECLNNCEGYRRVKKLVLTESNTIAFTNINRFFMWGSDRDGQIGNSGIARALPSSHHTEHNGVHFDARGDLFCKGVGGVVSCWGKPFGLVFPGDRYRTLESYAEPEIEYYFSQSIAVMPFSREREFAVGDGMVCALADDGVVECVAFGAQVWRTFLEPGGEISLPGPATAIDVGEDHACAILADGAVYCWGDFSEMVLGADGALEVRAIEVPGARGAAAIYAGNNATLYLTEDGHLQGFGANDHGQLDWSGVEDPVQVSFHDEHACVITSSGEVVCKGRNDHGQLGGSPGENSHTITEFDDAVQVAVGVDHACALTAGDEVWCWGSNEDGKLGIGLDDGLDYPPTRITTWLDDWERVAATGERVVTSGACQDDADCPAGRCWRPSEEAGVCISWFCDNGARCGPGGGACVPLPTYKRGLCAPRCSNDEDCSVGFTCLDSIGACFQGTSLPAESVGDACVQDSDCDDQICIPEDDGGTTGGYCTVDCRDMPCNVGAMCGSIRVDGESFEWRCIEDCGEGGVCRVGFECKEVRAGSLGASFGCVSPDWETLPPE